MRVETYSDRYFLDVMKLVENFQKESLSEFEGTFDAQALIEKIKEEKESNSSNAFLLIIEGTCQGILYGIQTKSVTSGKQMFQEIIWYVNEPYRRYGVRLLKEVENNLRTNGVSIMIMALMENSKADKLKKFYTRLGYRPMETHFVRSL